MMLLRSVIFLALFSLASSICCARADTVFPTVGARGDHQSPTRCLNGSYLIGLTVHDGAWIDSVTPKCAHFKPDGSILTLITIDTRGGLGGSPFKGPDQCPAGSVVYGLRFTFTDDNRQVKKFILECRPVKGGDTSEVAIGVLADRSQPSDQVCPLHQVAVGLDVNWGNAVNGVGTLCDAEPIPTLPGPTDLRRISRCEGYAKAAIEQTAEALARHCDLGKTNADRWTTNYPGHYAWCMSMTLGDPFPDHENSERSGLLHRCDTLMPVGGITPFLPVCKASAVLRNDRCENLDGTPSTVLAPGALSATGCGATDAEAVSNAKQVFAAQAAISDQPAAGACTYSTQHASGCLCHRD